MIRGPVVSSIESRPGAPDGKHDLARGRRRALRTFRANKAAVFGILVSTVMVIVSLWAAQIAPYDPRDQSILHRMQPPSRAHLLGTDEFGRDILSRVVFGSRVSLIVAFSSVLIGSTVGTLLGTLSGFVGGWFDRVLSAVVDMLLSFPNLMLGLLLLVILGSGLSSVVIAIAISMVPRFIRLARAPTLSVKEKEYVEACRAIGASTARIVLRHILPNIVGPVVVLTSLWMASAILLEANLSFLGLGVTPPTPTWGNMIRDGITVMFTAPWLAVYPGLAIMLAVMAFNMVGDGLRDALDPRTI